MAAIVPGVLVAVATAALVAATPARAAVTCRSGLHVFEAPGVRLFLTQSRAGSAIRLRGCARAARRPRTLWRTVSATLAPFVERRFGRRLAIEIEEFGEGGNARWLGWFDTRSGASAFGRVAGPLRPADETFDNDSWTPAASDLAVTPDGSIAYAFLADEARSYELFFSARDGGGFARRRTTEPVAAAEFAPGTLTATDDGVLRWRARGEAQSAPLPAAGAAAGDGTRLQIEAGVSCRAGAVVVADDAVRLFRTRAGTFACRRAPRARPVRIAPPRGHVALVTRAGRTLGYVVRRGTRETLNVLDLHRRRLRSSARSAGPYGARERILGLDPADSGGLAVVTESGTGRSVQYLAPAAGALARPREVARLATSRIDPATLRLRAREITWSAIGAPRSARL